MPTAALRMGPPERAFAWVCAVVVVLAAMFWQTSASLVATWSASGTYSHGFFIVPAFAWLVWGRRRELAALAFRPSWWALPVLAATGMAWLVGNWMALAQPAQFAMVAMVPTALAAVLGVAWVRALLFPLAFLFFAVPFGDSLVPVLMDRTADFTVAALRLSGVPVFRDGLHFEIPSGRWSVVDSCSGIRYLFACMAVSSLYAWTIFRGTVRRLSFIGVAIVVAIAANWIRAYAIVLLGHLSNNRIATGADHLIYGGIFFGVIMLIVFSVGTLWREDASRSLPAEPAGPRAGQPTSSAMGVPRRFAAVAATLGTMLIWPSVSIESDQAVVAAAVAKPRIEPMHGWRRTDEQVSSWRPVMHNPVAVASQSFAKGEDRVGVHLGLFNRPTAESKLSSSLNRLLEPDGLNPEWKLVVQGQTRVALHGEEASVRTGVLAGPNQRLLAWQWYWVDGTMTASPFTAALLQMAARLRGRSEMSGWVSVYTTDLEDHAAATHVLERFAVEMLPAIATSIEPTPSLARIFHRR